MTLYIVYTCTCMQIGSTPAHTFCNYVHVFINKLKRQKGGIIIKAIAMKQQKIEIKPNDTELINAIK